MDGVQNKPADSEERIDTEPVSRGEEGNADSNFSKKKQLLNMLAKLKESSCLIAGVMYTEMSSGRFRVINYQLHNRVSKQRFQNTSVSS